MKPKQSILQILYKPALQAAPLLLGWEILLTTPAGPIRLKIVETEAYHQNDLASHSFRGLTKRTSPMFKIGGYLYVYFSYGLHYAVNIVTGSAGVGEAVLLRAAEPLEGIDIMQRNRTRLDPLNLADGPGKLSQALGIKDTYLSGQKLGKNSLQLLPPKIAITTDEIINSPRVGISQATNLPWRFYIKNNSYVSKYKKSCS